MRIFISFIVLLGIICAASAATAHKHAKKRHHASKRDGEWPESYKCKICEGCNQGCELTDCGHEWPKADDADYPCCQCNNCPSQDSNTTTVITPPQDGDETEENKKKRHY